MKGNPRPVRFQLDTGATCNVVRKVDLPETHEIWPTKQMLSIYSQHKMRPLGVRTLTIENPKTKETYVSNFVVVNKAQTSILGTRSVQAMGWSKLNLIIFNSSLKELARRRRVVLT